MLTDGNDMGHIILRGGKKPNYSHHDVAQVASLLIKAKLETRMMIDCSHGNSEKIYQRQMQVVESVSQQIERGSNHIFGVMLESFLIPGKQQLDKNKGLVYGQSITDGCIGWQDTIVALERLAQAVSVSEVHTEKVASVV